MKSFLLSLSLLLLAPTGASASSFTWLQPPPPSVRTGQSYTVSASYTNTAKLVLVYIYMDGAIIRSGGNGTQDNSIVTLTTFPATYTTTENTPAVHAFRAESWYQATGNLIIDSQKSTGTFYTNIYSPLPPTAQIDGPSELYLTSAAVAEGATTVSGSWNFSATGEPPAQWRIYHDPDSPPNFTALSGPASRSDAFGLGAHSWTLDVLDTLGVTGQQVKNFTVLRKYTVATAVAPDGGGSVSGAGDYISGTTATLTATPAEGWTFTGWSGGVTAVSATSGTIVVDGDKSVTANFTNPANALTASISVSPVSTTVAPASTTVTWSSANATSVTVSGPGISPASNDLSGSIALNNLPTGTTVYTIVASNGIDSVTNTATFWCGVPAPVPTSLTPSEITSTGFTLSWSPPENGAVIQRYVIDAGAASPDPAPTGSQSWYTFSGLTSNTAYTIRVAAIDSNGQQSGWSDSLTVTTLSDAFMTLVPISAPTRPVATGGALVAASGGAFSVDNHGAGNYAIPLRIAPGRGGLQPQVSLSYSSASGNGPVGVGWSLSTGFPQSIVRGRSILARDGVVQGVTFIDGPSADKFYLDGKRLLCVSGTYGSAGSVYRTEVDSFCTITAFNNGAGTTIDRFELVDKSGQKFTFGKTAVDTDGFQQGGSEAAGLAYSYALKRVEDTLGNFIAYTYTPLGGGEYVLAKIDYTGGSSISPSAHLLFDYELRPDRPITFLANRVFNHRARLAVITAKVGTTTTAAYNLNYTNAANGGRSRLTSVAPLLADPQTNALQAVPATNIAWSNFTSTAPAMTPPTPAGVDITWGDTNLDGVDEPILASNRQANNGNTPSYCVKLGDFDGDGQKDRLTISYTLGVMSGVSFTMANGASRSLSSPTKFWSYFADPPNGVGGGGGQLVRAEGVGIASRITIADFNGDGRDDLLVHGFDGKIHVFFATATSFAEPIDDDAHAPFVHGEGDINWAVVALGGYQIQTSIGDHYYVNPMPCDLNGDGLTDYVCITYQRIMKYAAGPYQPVATGFLTIRNMTGVLAKPDGSFSAPFSVGGPAMMVPTETNDNPVGGYLGSIKFNDINCGALMGDFNGDGLTDFLVLVPEFEMQPGLFSGYYQGKRWALYLNRGQSSYGTPVFTEYKGPIDNIVTLPGGEAVNSYYTPVKGTGSIPAAVQYLTGASPQGKAFLAGFEGAAGSTNNFILDVNHDGLADLVFYAALKTDGTDATAKGWYAMLSTGNFTAGNIGFVGPVPVSFLSGVNGGVPTPISAGGSGFTATKISSGFDFNGDGFPDFLVQGTSNGAPTNVGSVASLDPNAVPFCDLVSSITDGLGRTTTVAYKAAKDSSIYTPGVAVSYPIREFPSSQPAVSDVWQDSGGATPAQFSYQYSGNRLDLSGRGPLGFHSFVTLDRQTGLFKYQFLTQSFPMTGLTAREQTYRWWSTTHTDNFRFLSSHDNTVVFDLVSGGGGTLWPFISQAVESRWEDGTTAHFSFGAATANAHSEDLFPQTRPTGAHITITAQSMFDAQTAPQLTLPSGITGYNPSDTSGGANVVSGTVTPDVFASVSPKITYGNLMQLSTDYGSGFSESIATSYKAPQTLYGVTTLTGLVNAITTTAAAPGYSDSAPVKSFTYVAASPLVSTATSTAADAKLSTTTTYTRDTRGRVTKTDISGTDLQSAGQGPVSYTVSQNTAFDDTWDLPTTILDNYGHATTTVYHSFLGQSISVTDANGAKVTTVYDALGRAATVTDVLKNLATNTSFALDAAQTVSPPAGWTGVLSGAPITGVSGVAVTSVYSITTATTVQPSVTTYCDRLGRVIRTIKNGFNDQQIVTDTAYNNLGQVIAVSLPYLAGGTPLWTKTAYDALGRVAAVTAPNGTVTTSTYLGRATQVSVDAPSLGGVDPAPQTNTTLVDAKGRTVKVWNADNVPSFSDTIGTTSTSPSISFALDGFGRMRTTTLLGQTATIAATYDALGGQLTLNDPDKGAWSYVNSALGQVLTQTDARGNVTGSSFDRLGRTLARTTSGNGSTETANFFYYDTAANADAALHTVAQGSQGWIGAPEREESSATGSYPTVTFHYYDTKGRPSLNLAQTDGKVFYTYSDYDIYSRVNQVRHFWKPAGAEDPATQPYAWQDFGYSYTYDGQSYLTALTDSLGRSWWDTPSYDPFDRITSVRKGSGHTTTRTYRPEDGVLTAITTDTIQNFSFGFDGLGNLRSRSATGLSETFGYDSLNRLTSSSIGGTISYEDNGNILNKTGVAGATTSDYSYDAGKPHAVAAAFGYSMSYDANGNLLTRVKGGETWSLAWTGFDKPRWMAKTSGGTTVGSEFHYNAGRSRVLQLEFDAMSGGAPSHYQRKRTYALGSTLELNYTNSAATGAPVWGLDTVRVYVPGPDGIIGAREFNPAKPLGLQEKALVYHYDHLGSITAITPFGDATATVATDLGGKGGRFSEDAWGQRRNPITWSGAPTTTDDGGPDSLTPRGFTGHEMLDDLGLIHMNGRIYDPLLGRFLSADLAIQMPGNLQSYNRYAYVMNNPLTLTDPTGFYFMQMLPAWAQQMVAFTMLPLAQFDHALDITNESQAVYNTVRSNSEGVGIASATAVGVAISRMTGAMDWAEAKHGEKIVISNGSASTTEITNPAEVATKAVYGAAGMVGTGFMVSGFVVPNLAEAAPKTELAPEIPKEEPRQRQLQQQQGQKEWTTNAAPHVVQPGEVVDPSKVPVYRGGTDMTINPREIKKDPITGLVTPARGPSVNTDPANRFVVQKGGPNQILTLPKELEIKNVGKTPGTHLEIVPKENIKQETFQEQLNKLLNKS